MTLHIRKELTPLIKSLEEISHIQGVSALLSWDQETYMPEQAIISRSEQTALIAKLAHQKLAGTKLKSQLADVINLETGQIILPNATETENRLLKETYREWKLTACLPEEFVENFAKTKAQSQHEWQKARKNNNFKVFQPYLQKMIDLTTEKARYLNPSQPTYDTLLDEYEPGLTTADIAPIFESLKIESIALIDELKNRPKYKFCLHEKNWDKAKQWEFSMSILTDMDFDFNRGRLDKSAHPFSTQLHPSDVRITTRIHENDFLEGLSSTIHECGHALYEQGLPTQYFGTPLCSAISFGIHESQSRFWENGVGKSKAFWNHYFPKLCTLFPKIISENDKEHFINAILEVNPSLIRVQADELTYNLHIFIRYELEKALFANELKVADLPNAWREKYNAYLGISSPTDDNGVLQDVHWSCGYFGYFPTYTIGNLYAAMLLDQIKQELNFEELIGSGQLHPIRNWLKKKVHQVGRLKTAKELIYDITGKPLSHEPFIRQMREKFGAHALNTSN